MELKLNENYSNFKLIQIEDVNEIYSKAYIFEHNITKTQVLFLKNNDNDKSFSITFKTLPKSSNGVAHILEHSVLNGSKKYPLKDPFMELNRSSINTFLNALTFPDKTMYPFSTTNESEYLKIMDIYLDAVFFPNVLENKKIFLQEGWRYELFNKEDEIKYSGVVYGEMKGAMSSPESIMASYSQQELLPNTVYGVNSGGLPENIVDLKYEEFVEFHQKYYHPSNSNIVLYGNLDIFESLELINENFLSKFNFLNIEDKIEYEEKFEVQKHVEHKYPASKEDIENKALFGISYAIGNALDSELMLGFKLLSSILMDVESSPLKKALLEEEIAQEVYGGFQEDLIFQPVFGIYLNNSNVDNKDKFLSIVNDSLKKIVNDGLDKDLIEGVLRSREFSLKEGEILGEDFLTKGVEYSIVAQDSWLYGGNPLLYLKFNSDLDNIKAKIENRYFENLIEKYLINNNHSVVISLLPDSNMNFEEYEKKKLSEYKNSLSDEEINELVKQSNEVLEFQQNEDSSEVTDLIKIVDRKDIADEPTKYNLNKLNDLDNIEIYKIDTDVEDITYLDMYFDVKSKSEKELQYLSFLTEFLDEISTKNYTSDEFSNELNKYFGSLSFDLIPISKKDDENIDAKFLLTCKFLTKYSNKAIDLLNELFNSGKFSQKKIKEMLKQIKSETISDMVSSGHKFAALSVNSKKSKKGVFDELIQGVSYFQFISNLLKDFNDKKEDIIKNLNEVYLNCFSSNGLYICLASKDFDISKINDINFSSNNDYENDINDFLEISKDNVAIVCSTNVNYVVQGGNFKEKYEYHGDLMVLEKILSRKYLYEEIRVKGGAYGNGSKFTLFNGGLFFSYRDPNLVKTLDVYKGSSNFIKNLNLDNKDLFRFIVGTISDLDTPLKTEDIMKKMILEKFSGITYEDKLKQRKEVLNCTLEELKNRADMVDYIINQNIYSVICSESSIKGNEDKFDRIIRV